MEYFSNTSEFFKMILFNKLQINKAFFCSDEIRIYKPRHFIFKLYSVHLYINKSVGVIFNTNCLVSM